MSELLPSAHARRTPRWVRGLKLCIAILFLTFLKSHPTMGAWIEISVRRLHVGYRTGRTPRWVRGLKYSCANAEF